MDFIIENWLIIASTLGIAGALTAIGRYIWARFTGWIEHNDLESQKLRLEKIKELIQLRKDFSEGDKSEELLVHTVLKTTTTIEIIKLSNQINRNNSGFKYYLKQFSWSAVGIIGITLFSLFTSYNLFHEKYLLAIPLFILMVIFGGILLSIIGTEISKKKLSSQFIAGAILQANSREDVDNIITKALQGESFVEPVDGWKGIFLGEMKPVEILQDKPKPTSE